MSDLKPNTESGSPKIESLKEQLKQLEPFGFDLQDFKLTLSTIGWEIKNIRQPNEPVEEYLKKCDSNGVRILYSSNLHKPIFSDEAEFGIAQGSVSEFFIKLDTKNVEDAIRKMANDQGIDSQTISIEENDTPRTPLRYARGILC